MTDTTAISLLHTKEIRKKMLFSLEGICAKYMDNIPCDREMDMNTMTVAEPQTDHIRMSMKTPTPSSATPLKKRRFCSLQTPVNTRPLRSNCGSISDITAVTTTPKSSRGTPVSTRSSVKEQRFDDKTPNSNVRSLDSRRRHKNVPTSFTTAHVTVNINEKKSMMLELKRLSSERVSSVKSQQQCGKNGQTPTDKPGGGMLNMEGVELEHTDENEVDYSCAQNPLFEHFMKRKSGVQQWIDPEIDMLTL